MLLSWSMLKSIAPVGVSFRGRRILNFFFNVVCFADGVDSTPPSFQSLFKRLCFSLRVTCFFGGVLLMLLALGITEGGFSMFFIVSALLFRSFILTSTTLSVSPISSIYFIFFTILASYLLLFWYDLRVLKISSFIFSMLYIWKSASHLANIFWVKSWSDTYSIYKSYFNCIKKYYRELSSERSRLTLDIC